MNDIDLNKKVAVVTGGIQGFGLAVVERFLRSGAEVVIWEKDKDLLKIFYGKYFEEIMELMNKLTEQEYKVCGDNNYFFIYSRNSDFCRRIE